MIIPDENDGQMVKDMHTNISNTQINMMVKW
jgi:hypothetical protein